MRAYLEQAPRVPGLSAEECCHLAVFETQRLEPDFDLNARLSWMRRVVPEVCRYLAATDHECRSALEWLDSNQGGSDDYSDRYLDEISAGRASALPWTDAVNAAFVDVMSPESRAVLKEMGIRTAELLPPGKPSYAPKALPEPPTIDAELDHDVPDSSDI